MKVREMIGILSQLDPEATVYVVFQPGYPLEHLAAGVAVRSQLAVEGKPEVIVDDERPNDVLIVDGGFARYGDHRTWEVARMR
jgi:hypothetical protein